MNDLKELEKFLKICRKQGVTDITFAGTTVKFGELPAKNTEESEESLEIPNNDISPDELIFYSAGANPQ